MDLTPLMGPAKYGYAASAGTAPASAAPTSGLDSVASPSSRGASAAKLYSPENPLFWFGVATFVTFGFAAFSTSVRVGKTTAGISLGSTK